ncbi:MAG: N-acetylmuramoyl-L-alanine amidase [Xanthomonadaceae bacterium]|nr:N-acetylmuramoyl-L-alanine amidase [Xanthomonadaceae bacterium]MDE1965472.1 N-acetylmuramoyl-L-alanine amidase [Xanthomonadaceae bacterium]
MSATRRAARGLALIAALALLAACAHAPARNPLATWAPSPNHDARRAQLVVLHYTQTDSAARALAILRSGNGSGPVSAHYLIGRNGHIYQLVSDRLRAWHAGAGHWGPLSDLNSASIGIELDNNGHEPFSQPLIDSLLRLLGDLTTRLHIPPTQIIGHEDLAPTRKDDPGPAFPWGELARAGFGRWPQGPLCAPPAGFDPWMALAVVGYPLEDRPAAVRAFHHHFRAMQGETLDAEDARILYNLAQQIDGGGNACAAPALPISTDAATGPAR